MVDPPHRPDVDGRRDTILADLARGGGLGDARVVPMTGPQESSLNTLAREAGTEVPDDLTKAEASERIEELQAKTGRGKPAEKPKRAPRKKAS